jgi:hypothetical protein
MDFIIEACLEGFIDSVKLIPFLFVTYLLMEWLEKKTEAKQLEYIKSADTCGPLVGGLLGAVPQCGFSVVASNLYSGGLITVGVLLAVFMSTSDEMLPIFVSHAIDVMTIVRIILTKAVIAIITGYMVDIANKTVKKIYKNQGSTLRGGNIKREKSHTAKDNHIHSQRAADKHTHSHDDKKHINDVFEHEHCSCEDGIWISAIKHTIKITFFILIISIAINIIIGLVGEDNLKILMGNIPVLGEAVAALVGLIPNCAASVVITELYLDGMISSGAMMSGLLVSAGVGMLVLFRMNRHRVKENMRIVGVLYATSVVWGAIINMLNITF